MADTGDVKGPGARSSELEGGSKGLWRACTVISLVVLEMSALGGARARQGQITPTGDAQNVRFEQAGSGIIQIFYDLVASDPRAVFTVRIEASEDGGTSFGLRPESVSGDVGASIAPGSAKRIVWESGKDVERLAVDRLRFRIIMAGNPLPPMATSTSPAAARETAAPSSRLATLRITSEPAGADVRVDGKDRGRTPLELTDLAIGSHRIVVSKAGYLENARDAQVLDSAPTQLDVRLTPLPAQPPATTATSGGSGATKWILIGGGAAGGIGGALAASGGSRSGSGGGGGSTPAPTAANRNPVISSITTSPTGVALFAVTNVSFTAVSSDPDSDPLVFDWTFGSGESGAITGAGATAQHLFSTRTGSFTVTVTARDNRGGTATMSTTIDVVDVTATWVGCGSVPDSTINGVPTHTRYTVSQNGSGGTVRQVIGGTPATFTVSLFLSHPRNVGWSGPGELSLDDTGRTLSSASVVGRQYCRQ